MKSRILSGVMFVSFSTQILSMNQQQQNPVQKERVRQQQVRQAYINRQAQIDAQKD